MFFSNVNGNTKKFLEIFQKIKFQVKHFNKKFHSLNAALANQLSMGTKVLLKKSFPALETKVNDDKIRRISIFIRTKIEIE